MKVIHEMNWLITGGCGFIGLGLIRELLRQGRQAIRVVDNLSVGTRADLQKVTPFDAMDRGQNEWGPAGSVALLEGDIRDEAAVALAVQGADIIVHLAANTGVAPSVKDPMSDCCTNVIGTLNLLEACRHVGVSRFVFASSGAPLGVQNPPLHEDMAPHPSSPYGASKLAGEGYCSAYYHCFGVQTVVLRFGNVYGEGSGHKQSVVAKFIKQALAGERLEVYGDGTQTRDFIHISDLTDAILRAATADAVAGETFQIATAQETSVAEMTEMLLEALRQEGIGEPETIFGPIRDGDVMRNYSDTRKARDKLGWVSRVPLDDGLRRTVRFFMAADAA
jgi:UDP-glucose 4-epimerase